MVADLFGWEASADFQRGDSYSLLEVTEKAFQVTCQRLSPVFSHSS